MKTKLDRMSFRFIGLALVLALLVCGISCTHSFRLNDKTEAADTSRSAESIYPDAETASDSDVSAWSYRQADRKYSAAAKTSSVVSLYSVSAINDRKRAMEAVKTASVSASQELADALAAHGELKTNSFMLDDIPVLEVYRDTAERKPLVILLHGLGQNKESLSSALTTYAENGYYAVAIDAYDHGERHISTMSCDTWAAALITVGDVDEIVAYYQTVPGADAEKFVIGGFSMGAVEALAYAELGAYTPAAVIALSGMCDMSAWQPRSGHDLAYSWLKNWKDTVWGFPQRQDASYTESKSASIAALNVTENLAAFSDIPVLCCIGTADKYFSAAAVAEIADTLTAGGGDAVCVTYRGVKHELTEDMISDSLAFLGGRL